MHASVRASLRACVGGWVRDLLLKRKQKVTDIDFVCIGSGIKFAEQLSKKLGKEATFKVFKNFGTAMINFKNENYEFVGARKESYRANSRKPIVENGTLQDDQWKIKILIERALEKHKGKRKYARYYCGKQIP